MNRGIDIASLIGGLAITALGGLLLADQRGALDLTLGWAGAAVAAAAGMVLLTWGLAMRRRQ